MQVCLKNFDRTSVFKILELSFSLRRRGGEEDDGSASEGITRAVVGRIVKKHW